MVVGGIRLIRDRPRKSVDGVSPCLRGNAGPVTRDNHRVQAIAELMDVVQDLCRYAAVVRVVGQTARAQTLIEQCGDLLAHRARLFQRLFSDSSSQSQPADVHSRMLPRGISWTN